MSPLYTGFRRTPVTWNENRAGIFGFIMPIPHNSKCRYCERGAADAKPKAQILLDVLSSILASQIRKYHPDLNKDDKDAAEKFKEISCAYDILGDKEKRKKYDNNEIDANQ